MAKTKSINPNISPNLVGIQITDQQAVFTVASFDVYSKQQDLLSKNYGGSLSAPYTLEAMPLEDQGRGTPQHQELPLPGGDVEFMAVFGSLNKLFSAAVLNILTKFPGSFLFSAPAGKLNAQVIQRNYASRETVFEVPQNNMTIRTAEQYGHDANSMLYLKDLRVLLPSENFSADVKSVGLTDRNGIKYLKITINKLWPGAVSGDNRPFHVLLGKAEEESFITQLSNIERYIVKTRTSRGFHFVLRWAQNPANEFTWPCSDGYNPDVETEGFRVFYYQLNIFSNDFDLEAGDQLYSRYLPSSLQNDEDEVYDRLKALVRVWGRSFDEVHTQMHAAKRQLLSPVYQNNKESGLFKLEELVQNGWEALSVDERFYEDLHRSSNYLMRYKGSKRLLEEFFLLCGIIPGLITIEEQVLVASGKTESPEYSLYLEAAGDKDLGLDYRKSFREQGYTIDIKTDETKSYVYQGGAVSRNLYSAISETHVLNSKLLKLTFNRQAILDLYQLQVGSLPAAFTAEVDGQIERAKKVYIPYLLDFLLPATAIVYSPDPQMPDGFNADVATRYQCRTVKLSWSNNGGNHDEWKIERSSDTNFSAPEVIWLDVDMLTYSDQVPMDATTYYYRISGSFDRSLSSGHSVPISVFVPLCPPKTFTASYSSGFVDMSWTNGSTNNDKLVIYRSQSLENLFSSPVADISPSALSYRDSNPPLGTVYYGVANHKGSLTAVSAPAMVSVLENYVFYTTTGYINGSVNTPEVVLQYSDDITAITDGYAGFSVSIDGGPGFAFTFGSYVLGSNTVTFYNTSLEDKISSTSDVRISGGRGFVKGRQNVVSQPCDRLPLINNTVSYFPTPVMLGVVAVDEPSALVRSAWEALSADNLQYVDEIIMEVSYNASFTLIASTHGNDASVSRYDLTLASAKDRTYYFRIRYRNGINYSVWSNVVSFKFTSQLIRAGSEYICVRHRPDLFYSYHNGSRTIYKSDIYLSEGSYREFLETVYYTSNISGLQPYNPEFYANSGTYTFANRSNAIKAHLEGKYGKTLQTTTSSDTQIVCAETDPCGMMDMVVNVGSTNNSLNEDPFSEVISLTVAITGAMGDRNPANVSIRLFNEAGTQTMYVTDSYNVVLRGMAPGKYRVVAQVGECSREQWVDAQFPYRAQSHQYFSVNQLMGREKRLTYVTTSNGTRSGFFPVHTYQFQVYHENSGSLNADMLSKIKVEGTFTLFLKSGNGVTLNPGSIGSGEYGVTGVISSDGVSGTPGPVPATVTVTNPSLLQLRDGGYALHYNLINSYTANFYLFSPIDRPIKQLKLIVDPSIGAVGRFPLVNYVDQAVYLQ